MKVTIMVTDVLIIFRLAAIEQSLRHPQSWELQVMTIQQVAHILVSLGFLDPEAAARLTEASTTITPQPGLSTLRFADLVGLIQLVHPEDDLSSPEAEQGHVLIAHGETTEAALAAAGFVLKTDGRLQWTDGRIVQNSHGECSDSIANDFSRLAPTCVCAQKGR